MVDFSEASSGLVEELVVFGASFAGAGFEAIRTKGKRIGGETAQESFP